MSELKPITLSNLTRFANKLKDWFVLIKDSVRSVNYNTPDSDGNIALNRVDWAGELESSSTQSSDQEFIIRASGGDASVEDGSAWLNVIYGKSVKTGYIPEETEMEVIPYGDDDHLSATIDWDTFRAYVNEDSDITLTYIDDWSAAPTLYGVTVTGTPVNGDQIKLHYVKLARGTITNATPTAFVATGWNLFDSTNHYAHVINYSTSYGYRIDGDYTALKFSATPTGTQTSLSVTSNLISGFPENWKEGYIHVTGDNASNTAIYPTWSDWGDGYSEHGVSFAAFSKDEIDLDVVMNGDEGNNVAALFPYGLLQVGTTRDEINLNLGQAISRIQRIAYTDSAWEDAQDSGRPCDCDENYIYIVKASADSTALSGDYAVDGAYTVSDHGLEYFEGTSIEVLAHTIYGSSLKNKLERDTLTISQQTLTSTQQTQVRTNIGAASASEISSNLGTPTSSLQGYLRRKIETYTNKTIPADGYLKIDSYSGLGLSNSDYLMAMNIRGFSTFSNKTSYVVAKGSNGTDIYLIGEAGTIGSITVEYFVWCGYANTSI